jgi:hypothetical protein
LAAKGKSGAVGWSIPWCLMPVDFLQQREMVSLTIELRHDDKVETLRRAN